MQGNEIGKYCDALLKVWKQGDSYFGKYLTAEGYFSNDEYSSGYEKARTCLARYGTIVDLSSYKIGGITVERGIVELENTNEGVVVYDGFIFVTPYLYEPYIIVKGIDLPQKISLI